MTPAKHILLLAEPDEAQQLQPRLSADLVRSDPYEALADLGRQPWNTVVMTAPRPELLSLCRSVRRLQQQARVVAIGTPAAEMELRTLSGSLLDDYFIAPLSTQELSSLRGEAAGPTPPAPAGGNLSPRQLAAIIESAVTLSSLEHHVADLVGRKLGNSVHWSPIDRVPPEVKPLLLMATPQPRVLALRAPIDVLDPSARGMLHELQQLLPALTETAKRTDSLQQLAITDHLSGAYNRRYFYHMVDQIIARSRNRNHRVTLLLFDIDNFKHYNDTYGYAAGDEIIKEVASLMKKTSRVHDIIARIGGDEFAILFWDPDQPREPDSRPLETANALADRFRQAVTSHEFPSLGAEARGAVTISGGMAGFPADGDTCRDLLRAADGALKKAKKAGKNSIQIAWTQ